MRPKIKVQAIIPLAGAGTRLRTKVPKPLLTLGRRSMLFHVLRQFDLCRSVASVIVVTQKAYFERFERMVRRSRIKKPVCFVEGGDTRGDSVRNGLGALSEDTEFVVVHDGARPLVTAKLIDACVGAAREHGAVIAAVPVKPTIKRADPVTRAVEATLERSRLWEVQTPQVFRRELICRAYARADRLTATDDAALVEAMGVPVMVVLGDNTNIKVTTPEDIAVAELFLKKRV